MSLRGRVPVLLLLSGLLALTLVSGALALDSLGGISRGDRPVDVSLASVGDLAAGALMPGDPLGPQVLRVTAAGDLEYGLRPTATGSAALLAALDIEIRDGTGQLLYAGPLQDAKINDYFAGGLGRQLADGTTDVLTVTGRVRLTAGNEIAGATIAVVWQVSAKPILEPA